MRRGQGSQRDQGVRRDKESPFWRRDQGSQRDLGPRRGKELLRAVLAKRSRIAKRSRTAKR